MREQTPTTAQLTQRRDRYHVRLLWHIAAFFVVNAGLWELDLNVGQGGIQWVFWITFIWGVLLWLHLIAWFINGRKFERQRAEMYVAGERRIAS